MKKHPQLFNTIFIVIGGALLVYAIANENISPYIKIAGLVIIMFGLYHATSHWSETKDDYKKDSEE